MGSSDKTAEPFESYKAMSERPPTEEELYWQRISRENARQQDAQMAGFRQTGVTGLDPRSAAMGVAMPRTAYDMELARMERNSINLERRIERIEVANVSNAPIRIKEQEFLATVESRLDVLATNLEGRGGVFARLDALESQHVLPTIALRLSPQAQQNLKALVSAAQGAFEFLGRQPSTDETRAHFYALRDALEGMQP